MAESTKREAGSGQEIIIKTEAPTMTKPDAWKAGTGQEIEALYAWIATEPSGGEGVCGAQMGGTMMPLVGADMERIRSLREYAEATRAATGYPIRLVRFSKRDDLEVLP